MLYKDQHIAVLGAGESGEAAARLLKEEGAMVTLLDSADLKKLRSKIEKISPLGIALIAGPDADADDYRYDLGVISPGIDPATPLVQNFLRKRIDMIGELELSFELCECPVVAITGTNGKTTTTELVARMFNACGVRTLASGNIGPAFASTVRKSGELELMTLEVSSFQLERIRTFRPRIAVWLNFTPDHLDRYATMEEYRDAKLRVFENQTAEDFAIVNLRDVRAFGWVAHAARVPGSAARRIGANDVDDTNRADEMSTLNVAGGPPATAREPRALPGPRAQLITFSAYETGGDFDYRDGVIFFRGEAVLQMSDTKLRGLHNVENFMATLGTGFAHGLSFAQMTPPLCSYVALPHRCEIVRVLEGVEYVNDSKATNLDALEKALDSETRRVTLIAGGKDKGFEFDSITDLVARKCSRVILIGEMSGRIEALWAARVHCEKASSLRDAVLRARSGAGSGEVVLLSPGTSSFDMFKNYADRGNQFREIVQALP